MMHIDIPSLLLGIVVGIGIAGGAFILKRAQGYAIIYRSRPWRRRR